MLTALLAYGSVNEKHQPVDLNSGNRAQRKHDCWVSGHGRFRPATHLRREAPLMPGRALSQQLLSIRLTNIDKLKGFKTLDENILLTGRALSQQVFLIRLMKIDNLKKTQSHVWKLPARISFTLNQVQLLWVESECAFIELGSQGEAQNAIDTFNDK